MTGLSANPTASLLPRAVASAKARSIEHPGRRPRALGMPAVALLAACLALACSREEQRVETLLERGREAHVAGRYQQAVIEYRHALQGDPNRAETHHALALSLLELGRGGDAMWELRESIRLDPENNDARLRIAWLALAAQDHDEALSQATAILEIAPDDLEAQLIVVAAHLAQDDLEQASSQVEAVLERWPEEKRAYYNLAHVRNRQGRLAEAEQALLRYRELDDGSLAATRELVRFYTATGQEGKAETVLAAAIPSAAVDSRADLALDLAALLERSGREAQAKNALRFALTTAPWRLDARARLASILARGGDLEGAQSLLGEAKRLRPSDPEPYRILGDLLVQAGRLEEALQEFREGLRLDPGSALIGLREAEVLVRLGDLEASSDRVRALLEAHPEDPDVVLAHARSLALASRTDDAIAKLQDLLDRDPDSANAHFLLGVLLLAQERPAEALSSLQVSADRLQGEPGRSARRLLAEANVRAGDFEAARAEAERLLTGDPQDLRARIILAEAHLAAGSAERAEAALRAAPGESAALHGSLAEVLVRQGKLAEAEAELERARVLEPGSVRWTTDLVGVLLEQGQTARALEQVRAGMLEHPEEPDYPDLLGRILRHEGRSAAAEQAFRRAIELDPSFTHAYLELADLQARAGRFDEARQSVQRALEQRPGDGELLRVLGGVEYRRGDLDAAISAFEEALAVAPTRRWCRAPSPGPSPMPTGISIAPSTSPVAAALARPRAPTPPRHWAVCFSAKGSTRQPPSSFAPPSTWLRTRSRLTGTGSASRWSAPAITPAQHERSRGRWRSTTRSKGRTTRAAALGNWRSRTAEAQPSRGGGALSRSDPALGGGSAPATHCRETQQPAANQEQGSGLRDHCDLEGCGVPEVARGLEILVVGEHGYQQVEGAAYHGGRRRHVEAVGKDAVVPLAVNDLAVQVFGARVGSGEAPRRRGDVQTGANQGRRDAGRVGRSLRGEQRGRAQDDRCHDGARIAVARRAARPALVRPTGKRQRGGDRQ